MSLAQMSLDCMGNEALLAVSERGLPPVGWGLRGSGQARGPAPTNGCRSHDLTRQGVPCTRCLWTIWGLGRLRPGSDARCPSVLRSSGRGRPRMTEKGDARGRQQGGTSTGPPARSGEPQHGAQDGAFSGLGRLRPGRGADARRAMVMISGHVSVSGCRSQSPNCSSIASPARDRNEDSESASRNL